MGVRVAGGALEEEDTPRWPRVLVGCVVVGGVGVVGGVVGVGGCVGGGGGGGKDEGASGDIPEGCTRVGLEVVLFGAREGGEGGMVVEGKVGWHWGSGHDDCL